MLTSLQVSNVGDFKEKLLLLTFGKVVMFTDDYDESVKTHLVE